MQNPSQFAELYLAYLSENTFEKEPKGLYLPADYIMDLGGKRLRPQLVLWGAHLHGGDEKVALPIAHAVEVFHNFTLVHDDIMDQADLRRGKPTVHKKYGVNSAILSGDVMLIKAYQFLQKSGVHHFDALIEAFNRIAIEVCEGQQMDMDFEVRDDVTIDEYLKMIELKTAALLGGALLLGALGAGASDENGKLLDAFGRNMGVAFQIQDDYLDTFGDPALFGKKVGGDIIQNKKTILYLKALELASLSQRNDLIKWYNTDTADDIAKVAAVKNLFSEIGVEEEILSLQNQYIDAAQEALKKLEVSSNKKSEMADWAMALVDRNV
ncbi:MAG: polyprenyl synthetase family protein [Saprospiraceae bacterium]|nr:polyprenyl synthetase family protein [Saprospiraceae bacterium]